MVPLLLPFPSGLRSRPSTDLHTQPIEVDLEALLRKARKVRREDKAAATATTTDVQGIPEEDYSRDQTRGIAQKIEAAFAAVSRRVNDNTAANEVSETEEDRSVCPDIEEQEFNRSWGYLPPLDDEAAAIIEAIIANPEMAKDYSRIGPAHAEFPRGLQDRSVFLFESDHPDPYADEIRLLTSPVRIEETDAENQSHTQLWALDQAKINRGASLACYESIKPPGLNRIFHFLTVEAKKEKISADDNVGRLQSLNNASQALHNMFEFFREAGHEDTFAKVRFFSVVASTEALWIRIHRATREPEDGSDQGFIMPNRKDYPLRFEYRNFAQITKAEFARPTVLNTFENILAKDQNPNAGAKPIRLDTGHVIRDDARHEANGNIQPRLISDDHLL
ncbi:hypothetical protein DV736_g5122, partial [Chaetothyriales sp. CBS 134916]